MSNIEKSHEYLEYYDNELGQVYAEFNTFLYLSYHDSHKDRMLHNLYREMERIYIRSLCGFFTKKRQYNDDLIYCDFFDQCPELEIELDKETKDFINKSTAHLSRKRGTLGFPDQKINELRKLLTKHINRFLKDIDNGKLKKEYLYQLKDKNVINIKNSICNHIDQILILYKEKGVNIEI